MATTDVIRSVRGWTGGDFFFPGGSDGAGARLAPKRLRILENIMRGALLLIQLFLWPGQARGVREWAYMHGRQAGVGDREQSVGS